MRADSYLTENGYVESRSKAKASIEAGCLFVNGKPVTKVSYDIKQEDEVELRGEAIPDVSRGGLKLRGALEAFGLSCEGLDCVDIGASTGGFTDVLLKRGARLVYAVDCGSGQLHSSLASHPQVRNIENFNARELTAKTLGQTCDMAVMDVSFISQTLLYSAVNSVLKDGGIFLSLVKPQFEVGREYIGKGGIVKEQKAHILALERVIKNAEENGFTVISLAVSPIKGGDGNREYLAFFKKGSYDGIKADKELLKSLTK